jgi:pantetheine-phosphate adenylyltransferase, bacterial
MVRAIYPGSFDPVTLGHMDLIKRSAGVFDELIVCVLNNSRKKSPLFSLEERVKMLGDVTSVFSNVTVVSSDGLLVDFAKEKGVSIIVRGLRGTTDFDFELQMAQANKTVSPDIETVFMATDPSLSFISSSMVKEFASYGKSVKGFVPDLILRKVEEKYNIL